MGISTSLETAIIKWVKDLMGERLDSSPKAERITSKPFCALDVRLGVTFENLLQGIVSSVVQKAKDAGFSKESKVSLEQVGDNQHCYQIAIQ